MKQTLLFIWKTVYPLVVIAVGVGLLLGLTYEWLSPKLAEQARVEEEVALKGLFPLAVSFQKSETNLKTYYRVLGSSNETLGVIVKTANSGYGGPVQALVAVTNGAVQNFVITEMAKETPGLGSKAADPAWMAQFAGKVWNQIPRDKAGFKANGMDAISGATLTSMAVARDISDALNVFYALYGSTLSNTDTATNDGTSGASPSYNPEQGGRQ